MQLNLPNVTTRNKNGKTYYYYRQGDAFTPIKGTPGTMQFFASYEAAKQGVSRAPAKTFADLVKAYQLSPDYRELADNTKRLYQGYAKRMLNRYAAVDIRAFGHKSIRGELLAWRDEMALASPTSAELQIRFAKVLLRFGAERDMIEANHLAGARRFKAADHSSKVWTAEQIKAILANAPLHLQYGIKLALLTGQRISDLIRMRWTDIKDGFLCLRQKKTKACVELPVQAALRALLEQIPRHAETILTNAYGRSWGSERGLRDAWERTLVRCGFDKLGLRFHDLRGTAITCLADAGCTPIEIASMTGHSLDHVSKILKAYLGRTRAQATNATKALNSTWIGELSAD